MKHVLLLLLLTIAVSFAPPKEVTTVTVVMIRHGEKNDATGNLSCKGLHRALDLPAVLSQKFPKPSHIYVPTLKKGKITDHARMFQTITPFAVQNSLPINSNYAVGNDTAIAKEAMSKTGLVLLVWEHGNIQGIAKAMGVKNPPKWNSSDFNSIWIVTFDTDKKGNLKAKLNIDTEGLTPDSTCNF